MIRVLVADDHTIVREGLKQILSDTPDIKVADEAANAKEVITKVSDNDYDLVLLDISFPGRSGVDILKQLKCLKPKLPVLILSMYPEEQYAVRSLKSGASGYLTKESASDELITAIRQVTKGKKYITASLAERLVFELDKDYEDQPHEILSDREYQVMCLVASGKTVTEIAGALSLSVKTISTYRGRILQKMDMKNNAQLIRYAIEHGLVD
jgi:two-component system invasion response regulator UvrY